MTLAPRADLPVELDTTLDGSGNYIGEWIDTAGMLKVRATWQSPTSSGTFQIEQSMDQSFIFFEGPGSTTLDGTSQEYPLFARYFRVKAINGTPNGTLRVCVRAIG